MKYKNPSRHEQENQIIYYKKIKTTDLILNYNSPARYNLQKNNNVYKFTCTLMNSVPDQTKFIDAYIGHTTTCLLGRLKILSLRQFRSYLNTNWNIQNSASNILIETPIISSYTYKNIGSINSKKYKANAIISNMNMATKCSLSLKNIPLHWICIQNIYKFY